MIVTIFGIMKSRTVLFVQHLSNTSLLLLEISTNPVLTSKFVSTKLIVWGAEGMSDDDAGEFGRGDDGEFGRSDVEEFGRGEAGEFGRGDVGEFGSGDVVEFGRGDAGEFGVDTEAQ